MGYGKHLLRRGSGIYVCRAVVPRAIAGRIAQREVRLSTGTTDRRTAEVRAQMFISAWRAFFDECTRLDKIKALESAPLFAGGGHIKLEQAAEAVGMPARDLATAITQRHELWVYADSWLALAVADSEQLEREDGEYTWASVEAHGHAHVVTGLVSIQNSADALAALQTTGRYHLYEIGTSQQPGRVFVQPHTAALDLSALWVRRADVEQLRLAFVAVHTKALMHEQGPQAQSAQPETISPGSRVREKPRQAGPKVSQVIASFIEIHSRPRLTATRAKWKLDEVKRNQQKLRCFVELVGDPTIAELEDPDRGRALIEKFTSQLQLMPSGVDLRRARRELGDVPAPELVRWAGVHEGVTRMNTTTTNNYLSKLSECFNWAVEERKLTHNPLTGMLKAMDRSTVADVREDLQRPPLSDAELTAVFSAPWFATGRPKANRNGTLSSHFRPYYYWLPLLGLYVGGRINELAQLYLDDIDDRAPVPVIKFQLGHPDQINADTPRSSDKSLKTNNAQRDVPIHPELVRLGLLDYVRELRLAGHRRLFPELRYCAVKGYGKEAGKWFNERFLGSQLNMARNGTKTFHSLRHNFATALKDPSPTGRAKQQLLGHVRGESLAERRYTADLSMENVLEVVKSLTWNLPEIHPFDVSYGLGVVRRALALKEGTRMSLTQECRSRTRSGS